MSRRTDHPRTDARQAAAGLVQIAGHWEARRIRALDLAGANADAGLSSLALLRESSRCEARRDKLVRLIDLASLPRGAA